MKHLRDLLLATCTAAALVACQASTSSDDSDAGAGGTPTGGSGGNGPVGGDGGTGPVGGDGGTGPIGGDGGTGPIGGDGGSGVPGSCGDVPVVEFNDGATTEDDGSLSQTGASSGASATDGSCVAQSGSEVAFHFVAPTAGTWRFKSEALTDGLDTIMYARTTCTDATSELMCNDDIDYGNGDYNSRVWADLEANQEVFVIVDAYPSEEAAQEGEVRLNARSITRGARDAACDLLGIDDACATTDFCHQALDEAGEPVEAGVCIETTPPTMGEAHAYRVETAATYTIAGADTSRDVLALHVVYLAGGEPMDAIDGATAEGYLDPIDDAAIYGEASFTFRTAEDFVETYGIDEPEQVAVTFIDSQMNESEPQILDLGAPPEVAIGAPCDGMRLADQCATGSACQAVDPEADPVEYICKVVTPPTLITATAYYNDQNGNIAVVFEGMDPEQDVDAPGILLLDPDGVDIPLRADGQVGEAIGEFEPFEYGEAGAFRAVWLFQLTDEAGIALQIGTVRVRAYDIEGLASEPVDATITAPTRNVAIGAECDPWVAMSVCAEGLVCTPAAAAGDPPVCAEFVTECPDAYGAVEMSGAGPDWTVEGDLADATPHGVPGSCAYDTGSLVYVFTPPAGGVYTMTTSADDEAADTVLFVRSACAYGPEVPDTELACIDDAEATGTLASLSVDLAANEPVYIFVQGYDGSIPEWPDAWVGPFTLTVHQE